MQDKASFVQSIRADVKSAAFMLSQAEDGQVTSVLNDLAFALEGARENIIAQNKIDLEGASKKNLSPAMIDRLTLTSGRIQAMAQSVRDICLLENPCSKILEEWTRPNGLKIQKVSVPIGVLGMIYESRPNVTIDAAALAIKSRNVIILRGGSESYHSASFLHGLVQHCLEKNHLPKECVIMAPGTDRSMVDDMLAASDVIDVMIPRGGKGLTSKVMSEAKMPVFAHLDGNCHVYVHSSAKPDMALSIIKNSKLRRTGICGAAESLLFDEDVNEGIARDIVKMLVDEGVEIVGDALAQRLNASIKPATEEDWSSEYLDKKISLKYVTNVGDAAAHINRYGSHHTDCILCEDKDVADYFLNTVDSAIVMHNTSTQFADGGEFGFGAEIGIGTGKLHARGPVGLKQLCTFKYKVLGDGQTRP